MADASLDRYAFGLLADMVDPHFEPILKRRLAIQEVFLSSLSI
jgi:hypothetical protein